MLPWESGTGTNFLCIEDDWRSVTGDRELHARAVDRMRACEANLAEDKELCPFAYAVLDANPKAELDPTIVEAARTKFAVPQFGSAIALSKTTDFSCMREHVRVRSWKKVSVFVRHQLNFGQGLQLQLYGARVWTFIAVAILAQDARSLAEYSDARSLAEDEGQIIGVAHASESKCY